MRGYREPGRRGGRGEWLVAVQVLLIALVLLGPRTGAGLPAWPPAAARAARGAGLVLMAGGLALFLAGLAWLGPNLTPLPRPKVSGRLVQAGPYGWMRHPVYAGGIAIAFGWALWVAGWWTLLYALLLTVFLDFKAAREERWLREAFPEYRAYAARVRKFVPFIY